MVSFAYPNDRLDWALFSFVILYYQWFPLLEYCECGLFFAPQLLCGFDHFCGGLFFAPQLLCGFDHFCGEPLGASIPGVIQTGVTLEKLMIYQISAKK